MSTLDAMSVSYSALFINNLYRPLKPDRSERHYLIVGKLAIGITLAGGVACALLIDNLLELFKYIISIPAIFGASIWLGFVWRRLTRLAVILQVFVCVVIYAVIPNLFPTLDGVKHHEAFLVETRPRTVTVRTEALGDDVREGRAERLGQIITRSHVIKPTGIFFEKVARIDPSDPESPKVGFGRFHAELWIVSWFGIDLRDAPKSWLVALRFFVDALLPFVLLFGLSFVTRPVPARHLDRFFAKMHTPVQPSPEQEQSALEASYAHPEQFEKDKLFPGSSWEIMKPTWRDYLGFFGTWALVGLVIVLLWLVVTIR
jgi:SSS family solute:Na+ symporter